MRARRFDNTGTPLAPDFGVNQVETGLQHQSSISTDAAGNFAVSFVSCTLPCSDDNVVARLFADDGTPSGGDFAVNSYTTGQQYYQEISMDDDGSFVVTWTGGNDQDGDDRGIIARPFSSTGTPLSTDIVINTYTTLDEVWSSIVHTAPGEFVIAWDSYNTDQDGDQGGRFAQRLCADLDSDGVCNTEDVCPFGDDSVDTDGDGVPDDCDYCEELDPGQTILPGKVGIKKINTDTIIGNDGLKISATYSLAPGNVFADLDPIALGLRLILTTASGELRFDEFMPGSGFGGAGTRGWKLAGSGRKWSYKDKTGSPINGILSMKITDRSSSSPRQLRFDVKGKNGNYPVVSGDEPVTFFALLGGINSGQQGFCGQTKFDPLDCKFSGSGKTLNCRAP